ncbi:MAG: hypothetical protein V3S69_00245 [Dehalococcoidales bacterium]
MGFQDKSFGKKKDVPAEGTMMARLVGIIDLGHQPGYEFGTETIKSNFKVTFTYELPGSLTEDKRPHWVSEDLNYSDHEKSTMFKRVKALDPTGEITASDKAGYALQNLINQPCMINVQHNAKGWPKIKDVVSAPAGIPVPELANTPIIFNMDEPDMDVYNKFSDFVKTKMGEALDFKDTALYKELLVVDEVKEDENF